MSIFSKIALRIIEEQERVIGPLAWSEAGKVSGLRLDPKKKEAAIESPDEKETVDRLVSQYERLFGFASHEVCHSAAASLLAELPSDQVPTSLR